MRIEAACFTRRGEELGERLAKALAGHGLEMNLRRIGGEGPTLAGWAAEHFATADALLFIGAAGIALRAVAPHVASKTSDPAVLVLDEGANHIIPLFSGHIGGANALALQIGQALGARPVITTATDVNGVFAVDSWATANGYHIQNPGQIKRVSAKLLAGERVYLQSEFPVTGALPTGVEMAPEGARADIGITARKGTQADTLWLSPPALVLGAGCRKGAQETALQAAFEALCERENLHPAAFGLVCSIDLKSREPGLLAFCENNHLPLRTFPADELARAPGSYTASAFVEETTGVDNVCERSAVLGGGALLVKKTAGGGVTLAVAAKNWAVTFGEEA